MQTKKSKEQEYKNNKYSNRFILELIDACEKNINSYVQEAECLLKAGYFARSFALSYFALEELGKRLLCCDYYTNLISEEEFEKTFSDHKLKISYLHNQCKITEIKGEYDFEILYDKTKYKSWFDYRNNSLYVDKKDNQIINPLHKVSQQEAEEIFNYLIRNIQNTNYHETITERLGSKAFYK